MLTMLPRPRGDIARSAGLHDEEDTADVDRHHAVELLGRRVDDRVREAEAGVAHDRRQRRPAVDLAHHPPHLRDVGDVERAQRARRGRARPAPRRPRCASRLVDVGDRDGVAARRERLGDREADAAGAAGHERGRIAPSAPRIWRVRRGARRIRGGDRNSRSASAAGRARRGPWQTTLDGRTSNVKVRSVRYAGHRGDADQANQGRLRGGSRLRAYPHDDRGWRARTRAPGWDRASSQTRSGSRARRCAKPCTGSPASCSSSSRRTAGSSSRRSDSTPSSAPGGAPGTRARDRAARGRAAHGRRRRGAPRHRRDTRSAR